MTGSGGGSSTPRLLGLIITSLEYWIPWVHETSATPARVLWRWDNVMASSALKSALRFTACMQAVNLKTKLRLRFTVRRRRSIGSCGATPAYQGLEGRLRAGPGSQLAERRRRQDGRFKLARQPDLRDCVGKSLAMGHSPEQIAGRLALEHGRVIISHEFNLSFHLSSYGPEGLLAPPAAAKTQTRAPATPRRQPCQLHQTSALDR